LTNLTCSETVLIKAMAEAELFIDPSIQKDAAEIIRCG
jgi:hypothetical protein